MPPPSNLLIPYSNNNEENEELVDYKSPENNLVVSQIFLPMIETPIKPNLRNAKIIGTLNGALYFLAAVAGGQNIENLFNISGDSADDVIYTLGIFSSLCYGMFVYKTVEGLTIKPNHILSWTLSILAPFAASGFLTAGIEGARKLGWPDFLAIPAGLTLFLLRSMSMVDGAVKFPNRSKEVGLALTQAIQKKDFTEQARLFLTFYIALGFSISTTDATYSAAKKIATWLGTSTSSGLDNFAYICSGLGALGNVPTIFYWTHRGIKQLTYGGKPDNAGNNPDVTDTSTYIAAAITIPAILGVLGAATATNGQVFAKLGVFSSVIRVSTSSLYALCAGVPGLSTLARGVAPHIPQVSLSACKNSFFNMMGRCKRKAIKTVEESEDTSIGYGTFKKL